jgi:hypothetical protein
MNRYGIPHHAMALLGIPAHEDRAMTRRPNRWWLAFGTAAISAGLGTAINIATNAWTNTWAWLGVIVLTLAAALAAIASSSFSGTRSSTSAASTAPSAAIAQNQSSNSGPALQAAGNINITHNTARVIALISAFVWIATVSGLVIGAKTSSDGKGASANPADAFPPNASLELSNPFSVYYYPRDGNLPTTPPPTYQYDDPNKRASECIYYWGSYLADVGAAPTIPDQVLTAITGATSPVTILDMRVEVYAVRKIMSNKRIQCQYGAGGHPGPVAFVDLDHPLRAIPLDTDGDYKPDTTLPGGRFVVDPKYAETLHIVVDGSKKGSVYEYGLRLRVVENGRERTVTFGDKNRPLRAAFEVGDFGQNPGNEYFDWDYLRQQWGPAHDPFK